MTRGRTVSKAWGELMIQGVANLKFQKRVTATVMTDTQLKSLR
jgi:phosphoribosylformylglycinamidine (FGAM) synthase PurS component